MKNKSYIDIDKINKKLRTLGSGKFLKLQEGNNKLRILPKLDDSGVFWVDLTQHYGFKDDERGRAYACLKAMKGKDCPICQFVDAILKEGGEDNTKLARELRANTTHLMNVVDRSDNTMKIFSCNAKMLRGFLNYVTDEEYGEGVLDPESGYDFTITRTGSGFQTRYSDPRISPKEKPVGVEDWEDKLHDLDAEIEVLSYGELVKSLEDNYGDHIEELGLKFKKGKKDVDEEIEEEPAETSSPRKARGRPKGKRTEDDGEDEASESSSEDLDQDDEEDAPKRKPKKTKVAKKEEDEDDDFFEEDEDEEEIEEEEETPKKRARK